MAITRSLSNPSYSNRLENDHIAIDYQDFVAPQLQEIDPARIEFILDVDLDELAFYYSDKRDPHTIESSDVDYSLMIESGGNTVVGVVLPHFYDRVLMQFPNLIDILRLATVLAGETISESNAKASDKREALEEFATVIGLQ